MPKPSRLGADHQNCYVGDSGFTPWVPWRRRRRSRCQPKLPDACCRPGRGALTPLSALDAGGYVVPSQAESSLGMATFKEAVSVRPPRLRSRSWGCSPPLATCATESFSYCSYTLLESAAFTGGGVRGGLQGNVAPSGLPQSALLTGCKYNSMRWITRLTRR